MDIEQRGQTKEKLASNFRELHDKAQVALGEGRTSQGVALFKSVINSPYVNSNISEFKPLVGSCYQNLSEFYEEDNDMRKSIHFQFQCYQLYPENQDYQLKLAVNCKKEGFLEESLYFFTISEDCTKSQNLKNIYCEEICLIEFYLDRYESALEYAKNLATKNYKCQDIQFFIQFLKTLLEKKGDGDIFEDPGQYEDFSDEHYLKILELEENCYQNKIINEKKRILNKQLELQNLYVNCQKQKQLIDEADFETNSVTIKIPKQDWQSLFSILVYMFEILECKDLQGTISEKLLRSKYKKYLSTLNFKHDSKIVIEIDKEIEEEIINLWGGQEYGNDQHKKMNANSQIVEIINASGTDSQVAPETMIQNELDNANPVKNQSSSSNEEDNKMCIETVESDQQQPQNKNQNKDKKVPPLNKMNLREKRSLKKSEPTNGNEGRNLHGVELLSYSNFESFISSIFEISFDEESRQFCCDELFRIFSGVIPGEGEIVDQDESGDCGDGLNFTGFNSENTKQNQLVNIQREAITKNQKKLETFKKFCRLFNFEIEKKENTVNQDLLSNPSHGNKDHAFSHSQTELSNTQIKKLFKKDFYEFLILKKMYTPSCAYQFFGSQYIYNSEDGDSPATPLTAKKSYNLNTLTQEILKHFLEHKWQSFSNFLQDSSKKQKRHFGPSPFLYFREFEVKEFIVVVYEFLLKIGKEFVGFEEMVTFVDLLGENCSLTEREMRSQGFLKDYKEILSNLIKNKRYGWWKGLVSRLIFEIQNQKLFENADQDMSLAMRKIFCYVRLQINYMTLLSYEGQLGRLDQKSLEKTLKGQTSSIAKNIYKYNELERRFESTSSNIHEQQLISENLENQEKKNLSNGVYLYWLDCGRITAQDVHESTQMKLSTKIADKPISSLIRLHFTKTLYTDFLSFTHLNADYYINYFKEKADMTNIEDIGSYAEILQNFKKIISLFLLGFVIPGRPPHEDIRTTFLILSKGFQLGNLLLPVKILLEKKLDHDLKLQYDEDVNVKDIKELCLSLFKILFFTTFAIDMNFIDIKCSSYLLKILIMLGVKHFDLDKFFRQPRMIMYLLQLKASSYGNSFINLYDCQTKAIIINKQFRYLQSESKLISGGAIEFDILVNYKLLYGIHCDVNIDLPDICLYEIEASDIPNYNLNYAPNCNGNNSNIYDLMINQEGANLASFLYHFYFFKIEHDISKQIIEKIVTNSKIKMTSQFYLNQKSLLDISIPGKLKRSIIRNTSILFDKMRTNQIDWMACPAMLNLKDDFPEFFDFLGKLKAKIREFSIKQQCFQESADQDQRNSLLTGTNSNPEELIEAHKSLENIHNQNDSSEILEMSGLFKQMKHTPSKDAVWEMVDTNCISSEITKSKLENLLQTFTESDDAFLGKFLSYEGFEVEKLRIDKFLQKIDQIRDLESTCVCERSCAIDRGLDKFSLAVLFYLWTKGLEDQYFHRNIPDYWNLNLLKSEEFMKNTRVVTKIAKFTVLLSSLMASPFWFFSSLQIYSKTQLEGFTIYSYMSTKRFFSKNLTLRYQKGKRFRFFDQKGLLMINQCQDKYVPQEKINIDQILKEKFPNKEHEPTFTSQYPQTTRIGCSNNTNDSFNETLNGLDSVNNTDPHSKIISYSNIQAYQDSTDTEINLEENRKFLEASITIDQIEMQIIFVVQRWEHLKYELELHKISTDLLRNLDKSFTGFIRNIKSLKNWGPFFENLNINDGFRPEKYDQQFMEKSMKLEQQREALEEIKNWLQNLIQKIANDERSVSFRVDFLLGYYWPRSIKNTLEPDKIVREIFRIQRLERIQGRDIGSLFYMNCFSTNVMFYVQEIDIIKSSFIMKFIYKFFRMIMGKLPQLIKPEIFEIFRKVIIEGNGSKLFTATASGNDIVDVDNSMEVEQPGTSKENFVKDFYFNEDTNGMSQADLLELSNQVQCTEILVNNFCSVVNFQKNSNILESFYSSNKLHKKMVSSENFLESLLTMSDEEVNSGVVDFCNSEQYISDWLKGYPKYCVKNPNQKELVLKLVNLLQRAFLLVETIFVHIYGLKERGKHKQRDHFFYLNSLRLLIKYSSRFFYSKQEKSKQENINGLISGPNSDKCGSDQQLVSIASIYNLQTVSEQFQVRFELPMKFENDLKLNYVLNMPTQWINLQVKLIKGCPDEYWKVTNNIKRLERTALKEENPFLLLFSEIKFLDIINEIETNLFEIVKKEMIKVLNPSFLENLNGILEWLESFNNEQYNICRILHDMIKERSLVNYAKNAEKAEFCEFTAKILMNYMIKVMFFMAVPFGIKNEFLGKFMKHCASITNVNTDGSIIDPNNGKIREDSLRVQLEIFERLADLNKHRFFLTKFLEAYQDRIREMAANILKINSFVPEFYSSGKQETKNSKEARELSFRFVEDRCKRKNQVGKV